MKKISDNEWQCPKCKETFVQHRLKGYGLVNKRYYR